VTELAQALADLRQEAGLTQSALAHEAGLSLGAVCKLERDESPEPGIVVVTRLLTALLKHVPQEERTPRRDAVVDIMLRIGQVPR
jgi:transcriptional regulator with XRE-family HTH domain